MAEPLKEAQENLVKLFRDVYFKAGAPLSYGDEMRVRSTVETLVKAIRDEVIQRAPPPPPLAKPAEPQSAGGSGDPFPQQKGAQAHPAAKATPEPPPKRGFFGLVKSQVVPDPHKKK